MIITFWKVHLICAGLLEPQKLGTASDLTGIEIIEISKSPKSPTKKGRVETLC